MSKLYLVLIILIALASCKQESNINNEENMGNPFYTEFNAAIDFSRVNKQYIIEAADSAFKKANADLEKIYKIDKKNLNFKNSIKAIDNAYAEAGSIGNIIDLLSETHPDSATRNQALKTTGDFHKFYNKISLDENLYNVVKEYSETEEYKNLTGYKKRYAERLLKDFERNGFALPKEKRDELKVIKDKLSDLAIQFSANISSYKDHLIVNEDEIDGLPEDYKKTRAVGDGNYKIDLSYPSFRPFMKFSKSEKARKELLIKFLNRASDKNVDILNEILKLRKEMSDLLGYKSYAAYNLEDKMAKIPENVWNFENDLIKKLKAKAKRDYLELLEVKINKLQNPKLTKLNPWESSFYNEILLNTKYSVDSEVIKEYFMLENVIKGLFEISSELYDIEFKEIPNPKVWHPEVKAYEIFKNKKLAGRFYLDLFPRDDKFGHAASFSMISGRMTEDAYQIPTNSLVCNFTKPTDDKPSLLNHGETETLFHEFGHLLHSLLTTAELSGMAGTSVARDFVEVPSQLFEHWAWEYDALKKYAKHYKTGEVLPKELHNKMVAAKNVGSGINTLQQVYYGVLDMTLHEKFDPNGEQSTTDVVKNLQNKISMYDYIDGTHMQASFGHLTGYAAGYYGYLWALVYAEDVFSVFKKNGVMNKATGIKYRDLILSSGSTKDEYEIVKEFLGREPNNEAFLKSIGL